MPSEQTPRPDPSESKESLRARGSISAGVVRTPKPKAAKDKAKK
jgi:hypothetical protein